jgi:hypothetical protein
MENEWADKTYADVEIAIAAAKAKGEAKPPSRRITMAIVKHRA